MQAKRILTTAALVVVALLLVGGVPAIAGTITWQASGFSMGGNWNDTNHWVGGVLPTANDPVVFPANTVSSGVEYTVIVNISSAAAQTLDVHAEANLDITADDRLEIGSANSQTSNLDGDIFLSTSTSVLRFMYDHTMQAKSAGNTGRIIGQDNGAVIDDNTTAARTLTIQDGSGVAMSIEGGLKVRLSLRNDSLVHANNGTGGSNTLLLDTGTYTGFGDWTVDTANAILQFGPNITAATGLTGQVTVSDGKLKIEEAVTTTGNISFTGGTVDVAASKAFTAS